MFKDINKTTQHSHSCQSQSSQQGQGFGSNLVYLNYGNFLK